MLGQGILAIRYECDDLVVMKLGVATDALLLLPVRAVASCKSVRVVSLELPDANHRRGDPRCSVGRILNGLSNASKNVFLLHLLLLFPNQRTIS